MIKTNIKEQNYVQRIFWITIISSFFVWFMFLIVNPQGPQRELFFVRMHDFWADATNVTEMITSRNPYFGIAKGSYPPLAYLLFYPLMLVSSVPQKLSYFGGTYYYLYYYQPLWTMLFVIGLIITLILLYSVCVKQFNNSSGFDGMMTGFALCLSYPVLYTIERGNVLLFAILMLSIYIFYYDSQCKWKKEIALISLAIAAGIKLSPAFLGVLLIHNKDWKAALRTIFYGLIFFIVPFFFFEGGLDNMKQMFLNINYFLENYEGYSNVMGTGFITSYLKYTKFFWGDNYQISHETSVIVNNINIILKNELSLILFLGTFHFKEKWKAVLNITLILLILPKVSYLYNVLYLLPFTVLFLKSFSDSAEDKITIDKLLVFICLIMIFFVYRSPVSDFFNLNFAIPVLTVVGVVYSIQAFIKSKNILPVDFFKNKIC